MSLRIDLHGGFHLTPVQEDDHVAYVEHLKEKDITDHMLLIPFPYTMNDAKEWIASRLEAARKQPHETEFVIRRKDGFLVGAIGLMEHSGMASHRVDLGYWVARDYRRLGLATAAVKAMIPYAFQTLGKGRIQATAFVHNQNSCRVLEKAGLKLEGRLAGYHVKNGRLQDVYLYGLAKL